MQQIPCSKARVVIFDAYNPRDLADEVNFWLKKEGESMNVAACSYQMSGSHHDKEQYFMHSIVLLCSKNEAES